jgi:hypothetical protein
VGLQSGGSEGSPNEPQPALVERLELVARKLATEAEFLADSTFRLLRDSTALMGSALRPLAGTDLSLMADPYWRHLLGDVLHGGLSAAAATANELRHYFQPKVVRADRDNMSLPEAKQEQEDELQEQAINLRGVIPWENADESQTIAEPWAAVLLAAGLVHARWGSQGERRRFSRAGRQ